MSGILDRMAMRARGVPGGVQPRMQPHFAPASLESRATPLYPQESEIRVEGAGEHPAIEPAGGEQKGTASAREMRDRARAIRRDGDDGEEDTGSARKLEAARTPALDSKPRPKTGNEAEIGGSSRNHPAVVPRELGRGTDGDERSAHVDDRSLRRPAVRPRPLAGDDEVPETGASHAGSILRLRRDLAKEDSDRRSSAQSAKSPVQRDAKGNARVLPEGDDGSGEEKTEVHISIGHIELRAPRAEVKPQAAPFRPRVTLEEFLRRNPEGRR